MKQQHLFVHPSHLLRLCQHLLQSVVVLAGGQVPGELLTAPPVVERAVPEVLGQTAVVDLLVELLVCLRASGCLARDDDTGGGVHLSHRLDRHRA